MTRAGYLDRTGRRRGEQAIQHPRHERIPGSGGVHDACPVPRYLPLDRAGAVSASVGTERRDDEPRSGRGDPLEAGRYRPGAGQKHEFLGIYFHEVGNP
jgi:hypothetical protein